MLIDVQNAKSLLTYINALTNFDRSLLSQHCQTDVPCPDLPSGPSEEGMAGARPDLGRLVGGGGGGDEDGSTDSAAARMEMHRLDEEMRRAGDVETAVKALTKLAELSQ